MKKLLVLVLFITSCSTKSLYNSQRYCVVVSEVRYNGKYSSIKPKCQDPNYKGKMPWYRYPTPNVFPGDTVDVCDLDRIEPRF